MFLPHFDVLCDLLMNRRTAKWNLFVVYNKEPNYYSSFFNFKIFHRLQSWSVCCRQRSAKTGNMVNYHPTGGGHESFDHVNYASHDHVVCWRDWGKKDNSSDKSSLDRQTWSYDLTVRRVKYSFRDFWTQFLSRNLSKFFFHFLFVDCRERLVQ